MSDQESQDEVTMDAMLSEAPVEGSSPLTPESKQADASADDGKVPITLDGVTQYVPREEVASLWKSREQVKQEREVAQRMLSESAGLSDLYKRLQQLDPETQREVVAVLRDPSKLSKPKVVREDSYDEELPNALSSKVAEMDSQLAQMRELFNQQYREKRQNGLLDQIDSAIRDIDVLRDNPQAAAFAREAAFNQMQLTPDRDVRDVVFSYGAKTHKMLASKETPPVSKDVRAVPKLDKPFTGDDLLQGRIGSFALEYMRSKGL